MESEHNALSESMKDTLMIKHLLEELLLQIDLTSLEVSLVFCDNKAAIASSLSNGPKRKIRHIELKYHFFKYHLDEKQVKLEFIPTAENKDDGLTTILRTIKLVRLWFIWDYQAFSNVREWEGFQVNLDSLVTELSSNSLAIQELFILSK